MSAPKCKTCGKPFQIKRTNGRKQLFCSKKCKTKSYFRRYNYKGKLKERSDGFKFVLYSTIEERKAAIVKHQREHYLKNRAKYKKRSCEYYKKPERKEKIAFYKEFGKKAKPPMVCKKIIAIRRAINKGILSKVIKQISKGRTCEAYI